MTSSPEPIFFDRDPLTGRQVPTTYEALQTSLLTNHPLSGALPADIDCLLRTAVDYMALAYEQANVGRIHLYGRLTNDALLKATLALELGLRFRLGRGNRVPLVALIDQGLATGILPALDNGAWIWTEIRDSRNALAHGDPSASSYGPGTSCMIECVIKAVNGMYQAVHE